MEKLGVNGVNLQQSLKKVAAAFLFDEKLQRIITGPLLVPFDLNMLNTKFIGPLSLREKDSAILNDLVSKYIPQEVARETVLTTGGVLNLRKLSLLVNLASDLHQQQSLSFGKLLQDVDAMLLQSKLNPLVSNEEMYRIRNYKMDPNVTNFPGGILEKNPQLKLEPAYSKFVQFIKSGKTLEESTTLINSEYSSEHTNVTFEPAQVSGLKPVYGMNGV